MEYKKLSTNCRAFSKINDKNYCVSYETVIAVCDYSLKKIYVLRNLTVTSKKHLNQWIKYFKLDNYQKVVIGGNID
ncbi:hypothetical protein [Methanobrevibacter sp.]|uniref:hypothetical protein n=1 Tax=Methanobrevibacter sp. TaxID=66852 RepID=UPI00386A7024